MIAATPSPPYYAVIFTSLLAESDPAYKIMADKMVLLASQQPGFLGMETARESTGITVSYWENLDFIKSWKQNSEHLDAQQKGRSAWYAAYKIRICKVEREYGFDRYREET